MTPKEQDKKEIIPTTIEDLTPSQQQAFIEKLAATPLTHEEMAQVVLRTVKRGWSKENYTIELVRAKLLHLTQGMIDECEEYIQEDEAIERFEGEGGRLAA